MWTQSNERCVWTPRYSRRLNDLQIEVLEGFLFRLKGKVVIGDIKDNVIWLKTKGGTFSVKSFYFILELKRLVLFPIWVV